MWKMNIISCISLANHHHLLKIALVENFVFTVVAKQWFIDISKFNQASKSWYVEEKEFIKSCDLWTQLGCGRKQKLCG